MCLPPRRSACGPCLHSFEEPGLGEGPVAFRRSSRDFQRLGCFTGRELGEVAQLDQVRFGGVLLGKEVQAFMERQHIVGRRFQLKG